MPILPGGRVVAAPQVIPAARFDKSGATPIQTVANMTPAAKIAMVNDLLGNTNVAQQQGTSRVLYDMLPLDGRAIFQFFEGLQTRQFPFTNLNQNRLDPGESMAIERMYFAVALVAAGPPVSVTSVTTVGAAAGTAGLYGSNFTLSINKQDYIVKFPLTSMQAPFNKASKFATNDIIQFDNYITIPPQLQFTVELQAANFTVTANTFLMCVIEGTGSLLSPKSNF